eukprot:4849799-Pyramimonas_sp.AAC.1
MDFEAFDVETFSGTAWRSSQSVLASAAACKKQWVIASLDINELAEATGERERVVCVALPPGSASVLRSFPGFEQRDESKHTVPHARYRHQGCTQSLFTEAQKDHEKVWFHTHVLRRGVRRKQRPFHSQP